MTKVGPCVLKGAGRNLERRIVVGQELDGIVRGSRVRDTDGIGNFQSSLNGSSDDSGFILNHQEDNDFPRVFYCCWCSFIVMDNCHDSICHLPYS